MKFFGTGRGSLAVVLALLCGGACSSSDPGGAANGRDGGTSMGRRGDSAADAPADSGSTGAGGVGRDTDGSANVGGTGPTLTETFPPGDGSIETGAAADAALTPGPYVEPKDPVDVTRLPTGVPTVSLEVATSALATLEAAPFADVDVPASFKDSNGTTYASVSVHYRGAYALQRLMNSGASQRNWKIKFSKDQKYQNRREWNFTYEPDLRQKVAYDLMHLAGVRLPNARHVLLKLNGKLEGSYLEYEDPDNKDFLYDQFGDKTGDLYKAAFDTPNEARYFATTEILGTTDEAYFLHYDKKTNNDSDNANDYGRLRAFIQELNTVPDAEFATWIQEHFDVPKLLSYLVVSNFISNWDGFPHRPKNFWLYEIPWAKRWVFIPWDLDSTFQLSWFEFNQMGTGVTIFYQFDQTQSYGGHPEEGTERPLVRRAMKQPTLRAAYVARYREALRSFLAQETLSNRITALAQVISPALPESDRWTFDPVKDEMLSFVKARFAAVSAELASQP